MSSEGAAPAGLEVTGLSLAFGGLKALTDVSFSVAPGSITPSGPARRSPRSRKTGARSACR